MRASKIDIAFIAFIAFLASIIVLAVGGCIDQGAGSWVHWGSATVVGKSYTPESTTTGVGTGVTGNGKLATVVTTSTEAEKWTIIVEAEGSVFAAKATPSVWGMAHEGDTASVSYLEGWITGIKYEWSVSEVER